MKGLVLVGVVALLALGVSASAGGKTPAAACPIQIPNTLTTPNQAARGALVPTGARSLLLCDYGGLNAGSNSGRLAASVAVSNASLIELLARSFDTLRASRGVFHCPMDDGSEITATFAYPVAAADVVRVDLTGCQTVTNGKVIKSAASAKGQALIARLQRIAEPAGGAAPCATAKLSVSAGTGGENTTTSIGVTLQNDGAACTLQPTQHVSVEIDLAGRHAHVQGNPATLHPSGRLYHGGTDLLVAHWSNWCGSRRGISLVVRFGNQTVRKEVEPLPVCLHQHDSELIVGPP